MIFCHIVKVYEKGILPQLEKISTGNGNKHGENETQGKYNKYKIQCSVVGYDS